MTQPQPVYHLALRELHTALGARFGVHEGWSVPEHYGDAFAEYDAIRGSCAVVDLSARSRFLATGTDAADVLRGSFEGHVEELEEGRAMRTVALNPARNISDLVLLNRTAGIAYLVEGEAGRRAATGTRLREEVGADFDVRIDDRTESTCVVALTGPRAEDVVREHLSEGLPARLQMLHSVTFEFHGFRTLATRTSNAGEDGFELMVAPAVAQHIIETLTGAGVRMAGRRALEMARVESCIPAYHPDLEPGVSPAEADLDVLLGIPGGREERILSAVLVEGDSVLATGTQASVGGRVVGELRSCEYSPSLRLVVGLALVEAGVALPGTSLDLEGIRGTIVAKPLYRRRN